MFGTSENDVFGVGSGGSIVHFDGAVWQAMDSGTEETLVGVWASGPDDVYAVGDHETVLYYDGSTWSELFGSGLVDYLGVTGFDGEQIVALRDDGAVTFSDGVSWRPEPGGDLQALHGTARRTSTGSAETVRATTTESGGPRSTPSTWARRSPHIFAVVALNDT